MDLVCTPAFIKNATGPCLMVGGKKIRVLIANPTRVFRDLVYEAIRKQPGIEIVGDVSEERAIVAVAERTYADCVIVPLGEGSHQMSICTELLTIRPQVKIVAIGEGTNVLALYWRCKKGDVRSTYSTASRKSILQAIHFSTT